MDATKDHFCYFKIIEIINLQYFVLNIYTFNGISKMRSGDNLNSPILKCVQFSHIGTKCISPYYYSI